MQKFDRRRVPVPSVFRSKAAEGYRRAFAEFYFSDSEKRAQTRAPDPGRWVLDPEVRVTLQKLFNGKCAFCEQKVEALDIERFRPRAEAAPRHSAKTSHLYYSWLAGAWDNLYPACRACNALKGTLFPVDGRRAALPTAVRVRHYVERNDGIWGPLGSEKSLLLDPCRDADFHEHFRATMTGKLIPQSPRGEVTVKVFGLNRPGLVERRASAFAMYANMLGHLFSRGHVAERSEFFDFETLEYGGSWYLILREFAVGFLGGADQGGPLAPEKIASVLHTLPSREFRRFFETSSRESAGPAAAPSAAVPQKISEIHIKNFKAIETLSLKLVPDPSQDQRQAALLILGENSAGKSSILEAIALALCGPSVRMALKLDSRSLMLNEEFLGGAAGLRRPATVSVTFDDDQKTTFKAQLKGMSSSEDTPPLPVFAYGAFRQYLIGETPASDAKPIISLFRSDAILSNPERWLLGLSKKNFYRVARALREIFSIEQEFEIIQRDTANARCLLVNGPEENAGKTPLSLASSGFRSVLGMICEVMEGLLEAGVSSGSESFETINAVVLIDEVEAHLHPRWKMQIMTGLRKALPSVTFIATTHDPLCLRGMQKGEAVVVRRVRRADASGKQLPEHVELLADLPDLTQLSVEQLLTSDFFGLASTENPAFEQELEEYANLLTQARQEGVAGQARPALATLERDIARMLPIGHNATEQLIEDALLGYLVKRRKVSASDLKKLNDAARDSIIQALEGI